MESLALIDWYRQGQKKNAFTESPIAFIVEYNKYISHVGKSL